MGSELKSIFWKVVKVGTEEEFNGILSEIRDTCEPGYHYLKEGNPR